MATISTCSAQIKGSTVNLLLVTTLVYFKLGLVALLLMGVDEHIVYYTPGAYSLQEKLLVLLLNGIYVATAGLLLHRLLPRRIKLSVISSWSLLALAVAAALAINIGNLELSRGDIKSQATASSVLLSAVIYSYLAALVLCERSKTKFFVALGALVFAALMSYEREIVLFIFVPILLRFDRGTTSYIRLASLFVTGVIALAGYKYISELLRLQGSGTILSSNGISFWDYVQLSLLRDNMHTGFLELAFFAGRHPEYSQWSYFLPVQIERIFNSGALTNGQMASLYYTGGGTGTGFSALLEAWLNVGPFGVLVLPLLIALGMRRVAYAGSAFLFIASTIFVFKLQRSDFWPSVIGYLLAPLLVFAFLRFFRTIRRPTSRPV